MFLSANGSAARGALKPIKMTPDKTCYPAETGYSPACILHVNRQRISTGILKKRVFNCYNAHHFKLYKKLRNGRDLPYCRRIIR